MSNYLSKVIYLTEEQYNTLAANNSITINGVTQTYDNTALYVTSSNLFTPSPSAIGNDTSFITSVSQAQNGKITATKATIPTASDSVAGITKVGASGGAAAYSHGTHVSTATVQSALSINTSSGSTSKCLTEKGTWASFTNNAGTVTSVTLTSGAGITVSDSGTAITSSGSRTISITGVDTSSGSETQCLTKKGTWKTFGTSNLALGTTASTAMKGNTVITNVAISANVSTADNYPVVFATSNTNTTAAKNEGLQKNGVNFYYNPSTGIVTATGFYGSLTGNCSGSSGSCTGNATTATTLQNTRSIWGNSFDGSADITGNLALPLGSHLYMQDNVSNAWHAIIANYGTHVMLGANSGSLYIGYNDTVDIRFCKSTNESGNAIDHGVRIYENINGGQLNVFSGNCSSNGHYIWQMDAAVGHLRFYNYDNSNNYHGAVVIDKTSAVLYNACWNDYAEFRQSAENEPGRCIIPDKEHHAIRAFKRLQAGARIISDTYGMAIGVSDTSQTPIGISGRILAYPYRPIEEYHLGDVVCSAPNGTVDIMTREEIKEYPECIIGIVNEIPDYEVWRQVKTDGPDQVNVKEIEVKGRIWIDIK